MHLNRTIQHQFYKITTLLLFVSLGITVSCTNDTNTRHLKLNNGKLSLKFDKHTGSLISMKDTNAFEFLEGSNTTELPWILSFNKEENLTSSNLVPQHFKYAQPDSLTATLTWGNFKGEENDKLEVSVTINLDKEKPLSYWKINVKGIEGRTLDEVIFPRIKGIKNMGNEKLAIPTWAGQLYNDPRSYLTERKNLGGSYPGHISFQCLALYGEENGLYTASNDTMAFRKEFTYALDSTHQLSFGITNYPAQDSISTDYSPSYEGVIGTFKGDWITAAEIYREWAENQPWAQHSRLKNGNTPKWLEETALWVWNRGRSDNVLTPATQLKKRLGLPVNVFWHWWHGCSYDEGFPEYFPPREGAQSFKQAVSQAQQQGIHSIVYMNSFQWGNATESWEKENALFYAAKDQEGNTNSHAYNIFTGNALTSMCMATDFWKDKYTALSNNAVNDYGVNGVYMDQACLSRMCYDKNHDHAIGGGNYWVENFGKLTNQIRDVMQQEKQDILAGEGSGEAWLPYLDLFLTLEVSKERYSGIGDWEIIPFFQAVYHPYAITYGNYSSLVTPPYDELWPKEFKPSNTEQPLDSKFNQQYRMEQARSYVWGMQPTLSNYHDFLYTQRQEEIDYLIRLAKIRHQHLKYLLHGKFVRPPAMEIPTDTLDISKLSIYAGQKGNNVTAFQKEYPLVYTGAWQADDNNLGIAMASISKEEIRVDFNLASTKYGFPDSGAVYITNSNGTNKLIDYENGNLTIQHTLAPLEICFFEIKK